MNFVAKLLLLFIEGIKAFAGIKDAYDPVIVLPPAKASDKQEIVPFARTDVPYLGEDHDELVKKAEHLYADDVNRYKWLMAIHKVRQTRPGWIMDKNQKGKPLPNWGLRGTDRTHPVPSEFENWVPA